MAQTVSLPDSMEAWLRSRSDSGDYASAGEYLQELIRRDQADADERDNIVAALAEAEASGESKRNVLDILTALEMERAGESSRPRHR